MAMRHSLKYMGGYIKAEVSGKRKSIEHSSYLADVWAEILCLAECYGVFKVLYQSSLTGERSLMTAYDLLDELLESDRDDLIIAYVEFDQEGYEDTILLQTVVRMYGQPFALFQEPKEALDWLQLQ